uniref:Jacalin-like lectin domain-containing protein n=1 Tax=Tanacetum cinerariifolium TaxID=118510 RepID=A0A6L2KH81_TANCI|nr:jacalin-like lectin domain-containing protein [Tanacetum cinerariifolium]
MLRRLSQAEGLNNVELVGDLNSNSFRLNFNHHLPDFSSSAYIVDGDYELFPHAMHTTHDSSAPQSFPTTADQVPVYGSPSEFYGTYINLATNNFSKDNFIGKSGFGRVYKGQLLHSTICTTVAVKRLDMNISGQGPREVLIEIVMLASYKHNNLVSLVGFRDEDGENIIVYKHEVHGSLDKYLASTDITWDQRLRICLGAAHGLEYLHNGAGVDRRKEAKVAEKGKWMDNVWQWEWDSVRNLKGRDTWRGMLQEDGKFTVNTLTKMVEERLFTFESHGQETIWNKWIPKKVNIFVWKALKGRIPVRAKLDKRDIDLDSILFPCCDSVVETCQHSLVLFF